MFCFAAEHEHQVTVDGLGLLDETTDSDRQNWGHAYLYDRLSDLLGLLSLRCKRP